MKGVSKALIDYLKDNRVSEHDLEKRKILCTTCPEIKAKIPKVDYYGYGWKKPQKISMLALHTGCLEEFGGWFTSLNVQYQDTSGQWQPVGNINIDPPFPSTDVVFYQPHFVEYVITFPAVESKAIRVIGDAKIQDHWNKYTKNVSGFTSVTELSVYP